MGLAQPKKLLNFIDNLLNKITMYRLVVVCLRTILAIAVVLAFFGKVYIKPLDLIVSYFILALACWSFNHIFSYLFKVPTNVESYNITALILTLIITPSLNLAGIKFLLLAAFVAMASKYILAWRGKHIFNPVAVSIVITYFAIQQSASWWIGSIWLVSAVFITGVLIARKLQHFDLVLSFISVSLLGLVFTSTSPLLAIKTTLLDSSLIFFATVMLSEPLTTPPTRLLRVIYGGLVALLTFVHFGSFYFLPEIALVSGNIFSFAVSSKARPKLTLLSKNLIAKDTYDLAFETNQKFSFQPGQYLEWTLPINKPDNRGNRRYFTIASSPTEKEVHLGVKFYENPSSFKKTLFSLEPGSQILTGQLAGEFTLPKDKEAKLAFIAGGIGITPFRSMIKYLIDQNETRDVVLFYSAKSNDEFAYSDLLEQANKLGIKTVRTSMLTKEQIIDKAPDYKARKFYLSGPHGMVAAFEKTLKEMGLPKKQVKIDFFPGYV